MHTLCASGKVQARCEAEEERSLLTVDGCGYRDGARAARIDVAESIRERLDSIGPATHTDN